MARILDEIQLFRTGSTPSSVAAGTGTVFVSGSDTGLYFKNALGNVYKLSDTGSYFNILEYTASATYVKPNNIKLLKVVVISAGGSGGSGALGIVGNNQTVTGGTGGGGSSIAIAMFTSASLTAFGNTYTIVVGGGASGATAITTPNTNGGNGTNGGQSTFGTGSIILARAYAGGGGANGNTTATAELGGSANTVGTAPLNIRSPYLMPGVTGYNVTQTSGRITAGTLNSIGGNIFATPVGGYGGPGMGGGGAGGHMSSSGIFESALAAKSGSNIFYNGSMQHSNTPGSWGTGQNATTQLNILPAYLIFQITGSISYTPVAYFGGAGAGGGSSNFAGSTGGGNGGSGSIGCGGGGGGGSTTGSLNRSGRGGPGGNGYVAILEYY